jgi:outer membrane protein insertion porin family/translocation and assembly module TamA
LGVGLVSAASSARAQEDEPIRPVIRELEFVGNHALDDNTLRVSIATSRSTAWARSSLVSWMGLGEKRYFDEREFRRDVIRLRLLYSQSGYVDAAVDTVVRRDSGAVYLRFVIDEGEPVRVTEVAVGGLDGIVRVPDVLERLPLQVGDPFSRFLLRASTDSILWALRDRGYPFVEVFRGFEVNRAAHTASVTFDVEPGTLVRVAAVEVEGARAVSPNLVRRLIPIRVGQPLRERDVYATQRELYRTGIYDFADIRLLDSLPEAADDSLATVLVRVREGPLNRVRLGAGYGTLDCFRVLGAWTAHHALGGARTLDISTRLSKVGTGAPFPWGLQGSIICRGLGGEQDSARLALNYNVTASLTEPLLFFRGTTGTLSLFAERRSELQAYVREAIGGELSVTRRTRWDIPVTVSYRLERGSTRAEPATFCVFLNICRDDDIRVFEGPFLQATLGLLVSRNRQNSVLNPSRGSLLSAEVQWASPTIGSDTLARFTRLQGQFAMYHRVGRRGVLAWRAQYGSLLPSSFSFQGQSLRYVPPEERFYGGGPNSVRGFGQNQLGPVVRVIETREEVDDGETRLVPDTIASASGGNDLVFANLELRVPLPGFSGRLFGAVFVDAGQVYVRGEDAFDYDRLRVTPGVGLRFETVIGPIRLDIGYNGYGPTTGPLYERVGNELMLLSENFTPPPPDGFFNRLRLHFSVGQAF